MKIVFKCHTPFTMVMSIVLGELYFKEQEKILITSFLPNENFCENALKLNVFTKIYKFNEGVKTISGVEKQVDEFLNECNDIDMFFFSVFSDRFANMLVYKLRNSAKICIYPEGSSIINLQEKLPVIFKVINKNENVKKFFENYPICFENYDELWTFDVNSVLGFKNKIVDIDMKKIVNEKFISILNILFQVDDVEFEGIDGVYLDDHLIEKGWLFREIEESVLDDLFNILKDKKILIKAHPGQNVAFIKSKFYYDNCIIFENVNIPWEIIFLNIIIKNKNQNGKLFLISPLFSTSFITSSYFVDDKGELVLLSLFNILKSYMNDYLLNSMDLSMKDYKRLQRNNVRMLFPYNMDEVYEEFNLYNKQKFNTDILADYTKRYFDIVGNMICESYIYLNQKRYTGVFDALKDKNELRFYINDVISENKINWIVDSMNFYEANGDIEVTLSYFDKEQKFIVNKEACNKDGNWIIEISKNRDYCKEIRISFECVSKNNCMEMLRNYRRTFWRGAFWEKWTELNDYGILDTYFNKNTCTDIWIYGKGRIGQKIKEKLDQYNIKVIFIESNENLKKGVRGKSYILQAEKLPSLLIITPMQDYATIFYSLPSKIREKTVSLERFLEIIEQNIEI